MKWKVAYEENYKCKKLELKNISDIKMSGLKIIDATVPGNIELDFTREGILKDIYYSTSVIELQKLENMHYWYFTELELEDNNVYLNFEGIDTIADIYVNGELVKSVDNMMLGYDVYADYKIGKNEIVVHIKPVCIEARKLDIPVSGYALSNFMPSLYVRKPAHMYGWDIMPRIVSAGIWKNVNIVPVKKDKINEVFIATHEIKKDENKALMLAYLNIKADGDFITDYTVRIKGKCKDSSFEISKKMWHNTDRVEFEIENVHLWWPKNSGNPNLYDTTVELYYKDELKDKLDISVGVRKVELVRKIKENDNGEFLFKINDKKIFVMGTNWICLEALHSQDYKRLDRALELLDDMGCNMVRCWGGNVYESDNFYDFCDKKGIMVWQDFAMACAIYPQEERFERMIEEEVIYQVKRLRNHASIVFWAGDNECDWACSWSGSGFNPNLNNITREVLKKTIYTHDYTRPYIPSSPYFDNESYEKNLKLPEYHNWAQRYYFKDDWYKKQVYNFVSEIGYFGFNSVNSLKKFLKNPEKIFDGEGKVTDEYLAHATTVELDNDAPHAERIGIAYEQVVRLFGKVETDIEEFVKQSQISQAEALKFFIESFRMKKWEKTGVIWWNLLDGWPQISDAVVDYYFTKKLAYHYIKRSQEPVCLMFSEPVNGIIKLMGVNDLCDDAEVSYMVTDLTDNKEVLNGKGIIEADSAVKLGKIKPEFQHFYLIKWNNGGKEYSNHYHTDLIDIDYNKYLELQRKCGYDEYEGF